MVNISSISKNMGKYGRSFVRDLGNGDAFLPVILLEGAVVAGRTYQAYQRGGFIEARERGTEETLGSIFWLGGVQAFGKMGDSIGKRVLGLKNVDFEVGKDAVRNPLKNYFKGVQNVSEKSLATFKFAKTITSILLANTVIGFVVPKINQAITKKYQKSIEEVDNKSKTAKETVNEKPNTKDASFKGGMSAQQLLSLTNVFENDAKIKLLSTDVGTVTGRSISARNKHERREIMFRDIASIYFYLYCKNHLSKALNKIQTGRPTNLDPVSAKMLDTNIQENMKNCSYSAEDFEKLVFGDRHVKLNPELDGKFCKEGIIKLEEFEKFAGSKSELANRAKLMSELQPKLDGVSILTKEQVKDLYSGGLINNPKLLGEVYAENTGGKSINPFKFVAEKDLRKLKQRMADYVEDIIKDAAKTGQEITVDTLKAANKKNLFRNSLNLGAGFAVSAYFLSTAIPKMQYWITRKQTGQSGFPGIETYDKEVKK